MAKGLGGVFQRCVETTLAFFNGEDRWGMDGKAFFTDAKKTVKISSDSDEPMI